MDFIIAHKKQILTAIGAWIAVASFLNRTVFPQPPATAPKWKRVLHELLIDSAAMIASHETDGTIGPFTIPFFTGSMTRSSSALAASSPPKLPPAALVLVFFALASACAPGTDGLRQACTNTKGVLLGLYQSSAALVNADQTKLQARFDAVKNAADYQAANEVKLKHRAITEKALAALDGITDTVRTTCDLADAIDAGAKKDLPPLIAAVVKAAIDGRAAVADFMKLGAN